MALSEEDRAEVQALVSASALIKDLQDQTADHQAKIDALDSLATADMANLKDQVGEHQQAIIKLAKADTAPADLESLGRVIALAFILPTIGSHDVKHAKERLDALYSEVDGTGADGMDRMARALCLASVLSISPGYDLNKAKEKMEDIIRNLNE